MGYNTWVRGEYVVKPELPPDVIEALHLGESEHEELVAHSGGEADTVGLVNGQIAVIPGDSWTRIECRSQEPYKAYGLFELVETIVAAAAKAHCVVNGALYLDGEDSQDLSRIRVENNKVAHESPEFVWPNGDKGWY